VLLFRVTACLHRCMDGLMPLLIVAKHHPLASDALRSLSFFSPIPLPSPYHSLRPWPIALPWPFIDPAPPSDLLHSPGSVMSKSARAAAVHQDAAGRTALHYLCAYSGLHPLVVSSLKHRPQRKRLASKARKLVCSEEEQEEGEEARAAHSHAALTSTAAATATTTIATMLVSSLVSSDTWRVGPGGGLRSRSQPLSSSSSNLSNLSALSTPPSNHLVRTPLSHKREELEAREEEREDKDDRRSNRISKEKKKLSASLEVLLEAGVGACSLCDQQANTPAMLAAAHSAFPAHILARLLKACPNTCSALNLHARTVLHELSCNRAATEEAIGVAVSAHKSAVLMADGEGNTPLHLLCQFNGDRPDLVKAILMHQPKVAYSTNKDGQLPLHILCTHFSNDDNLQTLELLLSTFAEGAEVADDFGCLAQDRVPQSVRQNGRAERFIKSLVEAIDVDISIDSHDLVRPSAHPAPLPGKIVGAKAAKSRADKALLQVARRCDATEGNEDEEQESRLMDEGLADGLKKLRLPVGREHVSEQFWQDQLQRRPHAAADANAEDEAAGQSDAMQTWHPTMSSSSSWAVRRRLGDSSSRPADAAVSPAPSGPGRRARLQAAAATVATDWGGERDGEGVQEEEQDVEPIYLCSGKVRQQVPPALEQLKEAIQQHALHPPLPRRRRSASRDSNRERRREVRDRSRSAASREARAPGVSATNGRLPLALMPQQQEHLGTVRIAALDKDKRASNSNQSRQGVVSSSRSRRSGRSVEAAASASRTCSTLADSKGAVVHLSGGFAGGGESDDASIYHNATARLEKELAIAQAAKTHTHEDLGVQALGQVQHGAAADATAALEQRLSQLDFTSDKQSVKVDCLASSFSSAPFNALSSAEIRSCLTDEAVGGSSLSFSVHAAAGLAQQPLTSILSLPHPPPIPSLPHPPPFPASQPPPLSALTHRAYVTQTRALQAFDTAHSNSLKDSSRSLTSGPRRSLKSRAIKSKQKSKRGIAFVARPMRFLWVRVRPRSRPSLGAIPI
jgi:hypothetical protein